jgi:AcrR family transcriptional regulator
MTDKQAKARILQATLALLNEVDDPAQITVRQIADRAGVGIGLINYHFQTKEALLNQAVGDLMMAEAGKWFQAPPDRTLDPVLRLRRLFKETSRIAVLYPRLMPLLLGYVLQSGDWSVPNMILPLLREIFGTRKHEIDLRLLALQLALPLQVMGLHPSKLQDFAGIDLLDDQQRDDLIDRLIDNLIDQ